MVRVLSAEPISGFTVKLVFTDGTTKSVDLSPYLRGPIFEQLRQDSQFFRSLAVDPELGTIVWPNGADIDPDVLFGGLAPAWVKEKDVATRW